MRQYKRVPLSVEVLFSQDGRLKPLRLHFDGEIFEIERILSIRNFCPGVVPCIAPIEYLVQVSGVHKKIYYEAATSSWFSVKEWEG
jgi:hypothetical protein